MARTQAELGELVAKIFDRLSTQFHDATIEDAVLLVEISDPEHSYVDERGETKMETIIFVESTSDRVTVQEGIMAFAKRNIYGGVEDDDED